MNIWTAINFGLAIPCFGICIGFAIERKRMWSTLAGFNSGLFVATGILSMIP